MALTAWSPLFLSLSVCAACCSLAGTTTEHNTQPVRDDGGAIGEVAGPPQPGTISFQPGLGPSWRAELCGE